MNDIPNNHIIVAVGASAGGLEALNSFFYNVPADSDYTYLIVQHLSPDHKSLMAELLAKKTKIPITEIEHDAEIERNHIYVIPPSKNLKIENKQLKLIDKPKGQQLNLPIDILLESLAKEYRQNAVGIILSGTGSDGSRGIRHIKEEGGLVLVQQPEQAKFDGMPQSAINTGFPDFVVPVENMNSEIVSYFDSSNILSITQDFTNIDDSALRDILNLLKHATELDFNLYKRPTLLRRIIRRMRMLQIKSLRDYYTHLKSDKEEVSILYKEFLIGVTKFFRDEEMWKLLETNVIPKIVSDKEDNGTLKVWDVACSTGEETYSLAILFLEEIAKQKKRIELKIFATDISQFHLDIASKGEYSKSTLADVDSEYLARYFKKTDDDSFKVAESVRRTAIFSNHNVLKDPPFNKVDMVMCRNLLIYFQNDVQQKVFKLLHFSLKLEGFLVLGSSESLGNEGDNFQTISRKWKIYKNLKVSRGIRRETLHSSGDRHNKNFRRISPSSTATANIKQRKVEDLLSSAILEQFDATSIFIDENYNILEAKGNFRRFAELPNKGFTTNLLKMLPEDYKIPLTTCVKKAKRSTTSEVFNERIVFANENGNKAIDLRVLPIFDENHMHIREFVVSLMEHKIENINETIIDRSTVSETASIRIKDLEDELEHTQDELNKAIEETETSNEELQATNEELLASNEELQSTNEELQSVNEELHTVNAEHIQKLDELGALNEDINNLLESTNLGVIFLDENLRIRKFTPAIKKHFELYQRDVGRHLDNFTVSFDKGKKDSLVDKAKEVVETGKTIETRIVSKSRHFLQRISPFVTTSGSTNGAVITFIDIEKIYRSQEMLKRNQQKFKDFYNDDPVMHASINPESSNVVECNEQFYKRLGFKNKKEVIGTSVFQFYNDQSKIKASEIIAEIKEHGKVENAEITMTSKTGEEIHVLLNSNLTEDEQGNQITRGTLLDITDLKHTTEMLEKRQKELEMANRELEQFVSICSHDLKEPLATIRFGSEMLDRNFSNNLDKKGKEYIKYIYDASGRLADQINALLEHSRIGQNGKKSRLDIKEIVETVKGDLGKAINDSNAKISIGRLPIIYGYEVELRLLFQNLLSNALRYAKKDEAPDIRVSSFKDGKYHIFSINDNGRGIADRDLEHIFKIFNKVQDQDSIEGTGIGLAHCEKIVKLHGGSIWVDSQLGVGSTFHFKLKNR